MHDDIAVLIEEAEVGTDVITLADLRTRIPAALPLVRQMYYILAMSTKNAALSTVKAVEAKNGLEAWRRLTRRYEPDSAVRHLTLMKRIMNPGPFPTDPAGFEEALTNWELLVEMGSCDIGLDC